MSIKKTITTIFLVPPLGISKNSLLNNGFINGYDRDSEHESYNMNVVYLLFKPENIDRFREFLNDEYARTENLIDDYDYKQGYIVLVYKIEDKFNKDVTLIKEGKYSKTSKEFQEVFPKSVEIKRGSFIKLETSLQLRIFKKSNDLKEYWENKIGQRIDDAQEVWETYNEEDEILILNKIIENV